MGTVIGCTMLGSAIAAGGLVGLAISFRNLPDVRTLKTYVPTETSYIYDINGKVLLSLHGEANRTNIELSEVSPELKMAVLAIEDSHFYQHNGINPTSIGRAILSNLEAGGITEGASTITMQLVKNLFLAQDRTYNRKLAETVLALRIEQIFPKDEILEMYLNNIYWGHNNYGVETAAESYFNKSAADLTLPEAAVMAGMIQAPEDYSPFRDYQATKQRQKNRPESPRGSRLDYPRRSHRRRPRTPFGGSTNCLESQCLPLYHPSCGGRTHPTLWRRISSQRRDARPDHRGSQYATPCRRNGTKSLSAGP